MERGFAVELTLTALAILILVLFVLFGLRGKRRVGMTEQETREYWAMIDEGRK